MANHYSTKSPAAQESKKGPSKNSIYQILNYSRSLEVKKNRKESFLVHLN